MIYITTLLRGGEAYSGPQIQADSFEEAEVCASKLQDCQVTGLLVEESG